MAIAKRTRKQIETHISKCAESIQKNGLEIGRDLIEIRDEELWADEYDSWNQYLKDRASELVGKSFQQATYLIRVAQIARKIPDSYPIDKIAPAHIEALGKLAPSDKSNPAGKAKDYDRLKKSDVGRVLRNAGDNPTVHEIRAAVDDDLGIDRKAEAAKAKAKREAEKQIDLDAYLRRIKGTSEGWLSVLEAVPAEAWEDYASECDEAAAALESLSKFLRS